MKINLNGMAAVKTACLFSSLYWFVRKNALIIERDYDAFIQKMLQNPLLSYPFQEEDILAILSCVDDPNKHGVQPVDLFAQMPVDKTFAYIRAVFQEMVNMTIIHNEDFWEGYPVQEAIKILMERNPNFDLKTLLEIMQKQREA